MLTEIKISTEVKHRADILITKQKLILISVGPLLVQILQLEVRDFYEALAACRQK